MWFIIFSRANVILAAVKSQTTTVCVLPGADRDILDEVTSRLTQGLNPVSLHLFGSRARNSAASDSDYDIMAVVDNSDLPRHRRAQRARKLLAGLNASFDVVVLTIDEWQRQIRSGVSLANIVESEGLLLHDSRA
jgi:predicted nucleotidyltransferase